MALQSKKRVLMIGGDGIVLFCPTGKGVDRETSIAWDVPNFEEQLAEVLASQNRRHPVLVLFDGADQAYRKEENIPKLSPLDRPRFVRRKLEMAFPSYPVRAALEIKPPKPKGLQLRAAATETQPSYLFAALPDTEHLDRVGAAILESGAPVAGMGLLPLESCALLDELMQAAFYSTGKKKKNAVEKKSRWALLMGQHETGGLRQIVTKDGNLALTRMTPIPETGASGPAWVEEIQRGFRETMAYISRLGYTADQGLDVLVVCSNIEKQFINPQDIPATRFKALNLGEALGLLGAKSFGLEKSNYADALHAVWSGRKMSLKLPVRVPSLHNIMAPRLAARAASILFTLTAIGAALYTANSYQAYSVVREELGIKENQKQLMQREYEQEAKAFALLPVPPDTIKNVLAVKETLGQNTVNPALFLHRLKNALDADIILDNLTFEHTPSNTLKQASSGRSSAKSPAAARRGAKKADRGTVKMSFSFRLPAVTQLEERVARADSVLATLRTAFPDHTVEMTTQFSSMSRTGSFRGNAGAETAGKNSTNDSASFSISGAPL